MRKTHSDREIEILGLPFSTLSAEELVAELSSGGLLVAPAAPALASMPEDPAYREALASATWIIPDSGYMVLLWNLLHKTKMQRLSGLKLLRCFMDAYRENPSPNLFLVNPTEDQSQANQKWLAKQGFSTQSAQHYSAPHYTQRPITDPVLLEVLEQQKPHYILINIGGGTQEILGQYLAENLSFKPAILCTGAAIAFLTGHQASIPVWADKLYLGWLCRIMNSPQQYAARYFMALKLLKLMIKPTRP